MEMYARQMDVRHWHWQRRKCQRASGSPCSRECFPGSSGPGLGPGEIPGCRADEPSGGIGLLAHVACFLRKPLYIPGPRAGSNPSACLPRQMEVS